MREMSELIREHLMRRAGAICRDLTKCLPKESAHFYMAGGCMTGRISDIDLFPGETAVPTPDLPVIITTKNATTYRAEIWPIQICNYQHGSLKELVDSFDFAHIQVGVTIRSGGGYLAVEDVYYTEAFVESRALGISWFTGSKYPLSSIIRAGKYHKRGDIPKGAFIRCLLDGVSAVVTRGFDGYEDFKDQLDAVDLGLVPEEFDEITYESLRKFFDLLNRANPESEAADGRE